MLLRRITKHVTDQNWFAVFVDLLIVVFGVFIGIQVANWNQELTDKKVAAEYIERLKVDLITEKKTYQNHIDYYNSTRSHALLALEGFKKPAHELDKDFLIHLYQTSQSLNISLRRGIYDELLATGRITLITNNKVRIAINNFYETGNARNITMQRNTYLPYRRLLRMHMNETVQIEIRKHCDDIYKLDQHSSRFYLELPEKCNIRLPEELTQTEIIKLLANVQIQHELRYNLTSIDALLGSLENGINTIDATLKTIDGAK